MRPLFDKRGNHVGYQCEHCDGLWTPNMTPSTDQKLIQSNRSFAGRYTKNKAHAVRVKAARGT